MTRESVDQLLIAVRADLLRRGVNVDDLEVRLAEAHTWPDGSLGCPQPGYGYAQVLVDGWQVVVRAGGHCYDYRAGQRGSPRLCRSWPGDDCLEGRVPGDVSPGRI